MVIKRKGYMKPKTVMLLALALAGCSTAPKVAVHPISTYGIHSDRSPKPVRVFTTYSHTWHNPAAFEYREHDCAPGTRFDRLPPSG